VHADGLLSIRRLVTMQLALLAGSSLLLGLVGYARFLPSLWFGGILMVLNGAALARAVRRAAGAGELGGRRLLYRDAALRFGLLVLMLAVGYRLGLYLPWVAGGMLVVQAAMYVFGLRESGRWNSI